MRVVSWVIVIVSIGWLLVFDQNPGVRLDLPAVAMGEVAGTVLAHAGDTPSALPEFATRYTAAWNSRDPEAVAACFTPDARLVINGGEPHVGRAGIVRMVEDILTEVPDLVVTMAGVDAREGGVVYRWSVTGTHAVTGNPLEFSGTETWRFGEDGLIAQAIGVYDEAEYQAQVEGDET